MAAYKKTLASVFALTIGVVLAGAPAQAVTKIASGAYGVAVNLVALNAVTAGVKVGSVVGTTTGATPYDVVNPVLNASASNFVLLPGILLRQTLGVTTGVITDTASSPYGTVPTGAASSTVNNLALALNARLAGINVSVISLGATTLKSNSSVEGFGNTSSTGSSLLTGLKISVLGLGAFDLTGSAFVNAAPNTSVLGAAGDLLGIRLILNEQVKGGNDLNRSSITTNAVHLIFNNFLIGTNVLRGDIVISSSRALINDEDSVVPEPAVWAQMIAGFGLVGLTVRRRRSAVATAV